MKIAVDAMGGDLAPGEIVRGALMAQPQCAAELVLVGREGELEPLLGSTRGVVSLTVVHATDVIGMEESGPTVIRRKRDSSLSVAMRLLAEGEVEAVVSAGNSAAIVATAKHYVGLIPGLRHPAMAVPIPTRNGKVLLLDAGAYADADTIHLAQSAALAHSYLETTEGLKSPRIGLLNIGQEPFKGLKVIQRAFAVLERSQLGFIGNIEPTDLFDDRADAVVCSGFVGNMLLKMYEGISETIMQILQQEPTAGAGPEMRSVLDRVKKTCHYQNVGGAPLLGGNKTVVVAHGRSKGPAVSSAILLASRLAEEKVYERMALNVERNSQLAELKHLNTVVMLEDFRNRWRFS